jgi:hypothetical protein
VQVLQVEDLLALYKQSLKAGYYAIIICLLSKFVNPSYFPIIVIISHFSFNLIITNVFLGKVLAIGG